jgi:hypothetical protein
MLEPLESGLVIEPSLLLKEYQDWRKRDWDDPR